MGGSAKKSDAHLIAAGTYDPKRHGDLDNKLDFVEGIPSCPSWVPLEGQREWRRIVKVIEGARLMTEADWLMLVQYATLYAEFAETVMDFPVAKHAQLRLIMQELGFTPSSRSKLTPIGGKDKKKKDDWGDL